MRTQSWQETTLLRSGEPGRRFRTHQFRAAAGGDPSSSRPAATTRTQDHRAASVARTAVTATLLRDPARRCGNLSASSGQNTRLVRTAISLVASPWKQDILPFVAAAHAAISNESLTKHGQTERAIRRLSTRRGHHQAKPPVTKLIGGHRDLLIGTFTRRDDRPHPRLGVAPANDRRAVSPED